MNIALNIDVNEKYKGVLRYLLDCRAHCDCVDAQTDQVFDLKDNCWYCRQCGLREADENV